MDDAKVRLHSIKRDLSAIRKEITYLHKACNPEDRVGELERAIHAIVGNAERVIREGDDPLSPLLPWIVQRGRTALMRACTEEEDKDNG